MMPSDGYMASYDMPDMDVYPDHGPVAPLPNPKKGQKPPVKQLPAKRGQSALKPGPLLKLKRPTLPSRGAGYGYVGSGYASPAAAAKAKGTPLKTLKIPRKP